MIITCEKCFAKYSVPDSAISPAGRAVKCTSCSHTWTQYPIKEEPPVTDTTAASSKPEGKKGGSSLQAIKKPKKASLKLKAAFVMILLINLFISTFLFKDTLYKSSSAIAKIYTHFGLNNTDGLAFNNIDFRKIKKDDKYILLIKGEVVNNSDKKVKAPDIEISLYDKNGEMMKSLSYHLDAKTIKPGEKIAFDPKINNVPEAVETMIADIGNSAEITFRKKYEKGE